MNKDTDFRVWLRQKWFEYRDELEPLRGLIKEELNPNEYFIKYKWFLKQLYRKERHGYTVDYDN